MPMVRMITRYASPAGCFDPGAEINLPPADAQALVRAGCAEPVGWQLAANTGRQRTGGAENRQKRDEHPVEQRHS